MNDILFGNNNRKILKKLANRSLKSGKNYIAILAIMLSTLLFTSLFTIAISLQSSIQDNEMRTVGTSAHANAKLITENEYTFAIHSLFSLSALRIFIGLNAITSDIASITTFL